MNIISFDIEEWAIAKAGGHGTAEKYAEFDEFLDRILALLYQRNLKATFFCTGEMAQGFPQVVTRIQSHGHEIGCHSHRHVWINKMTETEAREDTHAAVFALEQCLGTKVRSYRAPAFSIGESNKWAFDVLAENGITMDSSVFPAVRDFGGFPAFPARKPCIISHGGVQIKEFPISMTTLLGKQLAYSGGGYFRFFPWGFVKGRMAKSDYTMCYFHIRDLIPEKGGVPSRERYESYYKEKGTLKNRYMRYLKANFGKKDAWAKFENLVRSMDFDNLIHASSLIDWNEATLVEI